MKVADILSLAKAALEDDKRATPGPWHVERDRRDHLSPQWIKAGLDIVARVGDPHEEGAQRAQMIAAARTREPALARWVEAVLGARSDEQWRPQSEIDDDARAFVAEYGTREGLSFAAALLRAADEAEAGK